MPPRSVKMKRRIFGFQRRVWWPKWTPASSSSRIETAGKVNPPWLVDGATAGGRDVEPATNSPAPTTPPGPPGRVRNARILAEGVEIPLELAGQRRLHVQAFPGERMVECETGRVEELAAQGRVRRAVHGVADDRQADRAEVDADLVGPPRLQVDAEKRVLAQQLEQLEVRHGLARTVSVQGLAGGIAAVAADRRLDPASSRAGSTADERRVGPVEAVGLDELLQILEGPVGPGDDEEARGVADEPVDDARPLLVSTRGSVGEDAVDEGSAPMAGRRVDDDPSGLVHDEEMLVLVRDPELDFLRHKLRLGLGRLELNVLPALKPTALRRLRSVHDHAATVEEALGCRTRADLGQVGEEAVEPKPGRRVRNGDSSQERACAAPGLRGAVRRSGWRHRRR